MTNPDDKRRREPQEMISFWRRIIRSMGATDFDITDLRALGDLQAELDAQLKRAVRELHDEDGFSWTEIGRALGITRQSAFERFRDPDSEAAAV